MQVTACIMLVKFIASFLYLLALKQEQNAYFYDLVFPGVPLARKAINTFIYSKHDALQSMKQGSCIIHH